MVNAVECSWNKEQVKALITFLLAEKYRHQKDIRRIERSIDNLKRRYKLTQKDIRDCDDFAHLFIYF